jgi:hypothetical protein
MMISEQRSVWKLSIFLIHQINRIFPLQFLNPGNYTKPKQFINFHQTNNSELNSRIVENKMNILLYLKLNSFEKI